MVVVTQNGIKKNWVYMLILQLILSFFIVLLFLLVMLIIIGNVPVMVLFTAPGLFLQLILMIYFWLLLFAIPNKPPVFKKTDRAKVHTENL